jgi:Chromo (CHRromatin Organisation MOdifier) domain
MDFITQLPETASGYDAILVFVDSLTKMVHFAPTHTASGAEEFARLFVSHVLSRHGLPRKLVSDRDTRFTSTFWREVSRLWGTKQALSTAFHPQTDGQTERVNRVLEDMLRHYVNPEQDNWDVLLPAAEFAVNNAWHEAVQNTPFYLNYGKHPRIWLQHGSVAESRSPAAKAFVVEHQDAIQRAKQCLDLAKVQAKQSLVAQQARRKEYADRSRREAIPFGVGDMVFLSSKNLQLKRGTRKLLPRWIGPFKVLERVGEVAYKLELPAHLKIHNVFHVSLLKPYCTRSLGGNVQPPLPVIMDGEEYVVERILRHRVRPRGRGRAVTEYLVSWKGYGPEYDTWESREQFMDRETGTVNAELKKYEESAAFMSVGPENTPSVHSAKPAKLAESPHAQHNHNKRKRTRSRKTSGRKRR